VPLAGAGAAGYGWTWEVAGDAGAVQVELRSAVPAPGAAGGLPASGSAGQLLVIRGARPGQATIRAVLARSFQPLRPPREAHEISVQVAAG
jgi:hypothetical protein